MERGARRGPGRPRGTSRGGAGIGRLHSSSSSEHSYAAAAHAHAHHNLHQQQQQNLNQSQNQLQLHQQQQSSSSHNINSAGDQSPLSPVSSPYSFSPVFSDQNIPEYPSHTQVRTPSHSSIRGRATNRTFHPSATAPTSSTSAAYASSPSPSPAVSSSFPAAAGKMDIRTPRSEKLPRSSGLQHALTFSTPTNKNDHSLRKRARTFGFGLDGAADDEAEVKGGHSLRKRARVDYAQIGDEDQTVTTTSTTTTADPSNLNSTRGRKRRVNEVDYDADDLPPSTVTKKRGRYEKPEKQRTESPASSRRKQPQRKPSTQSKSYLDQQPSDTELKDTIEVGVQYSEYESSDEQSSFKHSDTASVTSEQPQMQDSAAAEALTNQEVPESHNTVPTTTTQPQNIVSNSSADKSVKTEDAAPKHVQEFPEHENSSSPPIDPALATLSGQHTTDNNVSIDGSADEQQPSNGVPVSNPNGETEMEVSPHANKHSAEHVELTVAEDPVGGQAPQETQIESLTTPQLNESITAEEKASPQSQATETALTNGSSSTPTATDDAGIEQPNSSQPEAADDNLDLQERYKHLRPGSVVIDDNGEVMYSTPKSATAIARASQRRRRLGDSFFDTEKALDNFKPKPRATSPQGLAELTGLTAKSPSYGPSSRGPSSRDSSFQPELIPRSSTPPELTLPPQPSHAEPTETAPKVGRPRGRRRKETKDDKAQIAAPTLLLPPGGQVAERDYSYLTAYVAGETETYPEVTVESAAPTPAPEASEPAEDRVETADDPADEDNQQQPEEPLAVDPALESATNVAVSVDTPMDSGDAPSPQDTNNGDVDQPTPDEPVIESMRAPKMRKQFPYPRLTSPTAFIDVLKNHKDMNDADLYNCLESVVECLLVWQDEWQGLKLITDDEDNAVRRRAADIAFESKLEKQMKMLMALKKKNQFGSVEMTPAVEKDFAIKGVRVKEPTYKSDKAYYRVQDQIMAQAYGFEHDPRETMISKQDPINQRDGLQNSRLRNRPKLSQRAIEATTEDPAAVIVSGKRTRRPRGVEDDSQSVSRAATPVEAPRPSGRGRRRGPLPRQNTASSITTTALAQTNGEDLPVEETEAEAPPKRGRRRGPKPKEAAVAPAEEQQTIADPPKKKRGRKPKAETMAQEEAEGTAEPKAKRQRRGPGRPPNRVEIPAASFYHNPSPADTEPTPTDESRPTTSSSSGTAHTAESNYSFRDRKRKNYNDLANVGLDEVESKPKRARRTKKEPTPTPPVFNTAPATGFFPTAVSNGPALAPAPPRNDAGPPGVNNTKGGTTKMKIKLTNKATVGPTPNPAIAPAPFQFAAITGPGQPMTGPPSRSASAGPSKAPSRRGTPAPSAASSSAAPTADSEKDYSTMTKSEKMSASMKARWANGSMQRAVDKRKETLARKKETLAAQAKDRDTPMSGTEQQQQQPQQQQQQALPVAHGAPVPRPAVMPFGGGGVGDHAMPQFHAYAPGPAVEHQQNGV